MYFVSDMDQFWKAHEDKLRSYRKAAPLLCPPSEPIEAEYNGVKMAGYLRKPLGVAKPPVVMLFNGFEGVKEEGEQRLSEFLDRGLATLTWDGPGRGDTWKQVPMTGDHGPWAAAFIDVLQKRDDIDGNNIGVTGPNRGAFCAAKAAAYDQRIKCCSFASPGYDRRGTNWDDPYQLEFDKHLFHLKTTEELRERVNQKDLTIEGEAQNIKCPILIIAGGRDDKSHASGSRQLYDEVQGIKQWMVFPDAERNGNNVPFKVRPIIADFLAQHLGGNVKGC
jgi:2,6-dihydroxypseudooxynicotine hydrolase